MWEEPASTRKPVVVVGDGETFQDVLARMEQSSPNFKRIRVATALERMFGKKQVESMRRDATGAGLRSPKD